MNAFLQDIRYAVRTLSHSPGFTVVVILTLSLGIGANTTLFSLINAIMLRPPAIERPDEIVEVFTSDYNGTRYGASSYLDYADFRDRNDVFSGVLAYAVLPVSVNQEGVALRENCMLVTANYFSVLGVTPVLGRFFQEGDSDDFEPAVVAVLSYGLWQRLFGGNTDAIGQSINLNGQVFTIIGVAPPEFTGTERSVAAGIWTPLTLERQLTRASYSRLDRGSPWLSVLGRLNPEITLERVQAQMDVIAGQLYQTYPELWRDAQFQPRRITVLPEYQTRVPMYLRGDLIDFMGMLIAVVGLVLLITCANVANLMLARTIGRRQEIAVRLAMGVSRGRLMRQLLTESILLATAAGGIGLIFMLWSTDLLMAFQALLPVPVLLDISLDWRVLAFTAGVSLLTGILFGITPALQASGRDPMPILKTAASTVSGSQASVVRLRYGLVVTQIALSLLLLVAASLFLRSLQQAYEIDVGFDPENTLMMSFDLHQQGYDAVAGASFYKDILDRTGTLPNVASVSLAATLPLGGGPGGRMISLDAGATSASSGAEILMNLVGPDYFETTRTPLLAGRGFTDEDRSGAPYAIVINETFARTYLPDQDPLNQKIRLDIIGEGPEFEIVGMAEDGRYRTLEEQPVPLFYLPLLQHVETLHSLQTGTTLLIRTADEPLTMEMPVRRVFQALDGNISIFNVTTLAHHMSVAYLPVRFGGTILGLFGLLALLIAAIGLYGVMTYTVSQHAHGIGLRLALGAQRSDILRMVLGQTLLVTFIGIGIGLAVAFAVMPMLTRYLYGVDATDPLIFIGIGLLLTAVALLAGYLPARRAMRVEPMQVLRYE